MATFYLLPPRALLEQSLANPLGRLLPGLPLPVSAWDSMVEQFRAEAGWPDDLFLVPRDDLPDGPLVEALVGAFGAEPGDRVVEVGSGSGAAPRTWVVSHADIPAVPAAR